MGADGFSVLVCLEVGWDVWVFDSRIAGVLLCLGLSWRIGTWHIARLQTGIFECQVFYYDYVAHLLCAYDLPVVL